MILNLNLIFLQSNDQERVSINSLSFRNEVKPEMRRSGNTNKNLSPKSHQPKSTESSMEIEDISDLSSFGSRYERCPQGFYTI